MDCTTISGEDTGSTRPTGPIDRCADQSAQALSDDLRPVAILAGGLPATRSFLGTIGEAVLAASQSADLQEEARQVDLLSSPRWVMEQQAAECTAKAVKAILLVPETPIIVQATDQGLVRIFGNLVGNAVKYTPSGGCVETRAVIEGASAVVTVSDTGMGIPENDVPRLFEDFFRAGNAKRSEITGTGLGLSIVKRLVTSYRGLITVKSEIGRGTTVTVALPLADIIAPEGRT
jgi:signal transduction histidine kinase